MQGHQTSSRENQGQVIKAEESHLEADSKRKGEDSPVVNIRARRCVKEKGPRMERI